MEIAIAVSENIIIVDAAIQNESFSEGTVRKAISHMEKEKDAALAKKINLNDIRSARPGRYREIKRYDIATQRLVNIESALTVTGSYRYCQVNDHFTIQSHKHYFTYRDQVIGNGFLR